MDTQEPCPRCGKPRAEWTEQEGRGYMHGGSTFCSKACAEDDPRPDSATQQSPAPAMPPHPV